eukprot:10989023-Alexandrium_andersonii.AAC.1
MASVLSLGGEPQARLAEVGESPTIGRKVVHPLSDASLSRILRLPSRRPGITDATAPESTATCTRA